MLRTTLLLLTCGLAIAQPLIPEPGPPMDGGIGHHGAAHGIPIGLGGYGLAGGLGGGYGLAGGYGGYPGSVVKHTESVSTGLGSYGHGLGHYGAYSAYPGLGGLGGYGAYGFPAAKQITHVTTTNVRPGGYYGGYY